MARLERPAWAFLAFLIVVSLASCTSSTVKLAHCVVDTDSTTTLSLAVDSVSPTEALLAAMLSEEGGGDALSGFLIQFNTKVTAAVRRRVEETTGFDLGSYVPDNAFTFYATHRAALAVEKISEVSWVGYLPERAKISPSVYRVLFRSVRSSLRNRSEKVAIKAPRALYLDLWESQSHPRTIEGTTQRGSSWEATLKKTLTSCLADGENITPVTLSVTAHSTRRLEIDFGQMLELGDEKCLFQAINWLSGRSQTEYVQAKPAFTVHNYESHKMSQGGWSGEDAPIWGSGLTGEGEVVSVGDTGLSNGSPFFYDLGSMPYDVYSTDHRKIVSYITKFGDNGDVEDGHGTHVSGSVAGNAEDCPKTYDGYSSSHAVTMYAGMAPKAKLHFIDLQKKDGPLNIPSDLGADYFTLAYNDGVRISSNSWGASLNQYNMQSKEIDDFMHRHDDFLVLFAAGNSGDCGAESVMAQAQAKNALVVGSVYKGWLASSEKLDMSSFSSRGPTEDGRLKPDVSAPGDPVSSARAMQFYSDCKHAPFRCTVSMSGTSMATPIVAGNTALVREYFAKGYYPTGVKTAEDTMVPNAALLKAMLVSSAVLMNGKIRGGTTSENLTKDLRGHYVQGHGAVNLSGVLRFPKSKFGLYVDQDSGVNTGDIQNYCFTIPSKFINGTTGLSATLVWTDAPGTPLAAQNLVNNLDLVVKCDNGNEPSVLGNAPFMKTADRVNNVERVLLEGKKLVGVKSCMVSVVGVNVPVKGHGYLLKDQMFALVVTGDVVLAKDPSTCKKQAPKCVNDCGGKGNCDDDGLCVCNTGYDGVDCSANTCPNSCSGNGECKEGVCTCADGFIGVDCKSDFLEISAGLFTTTKITIPAFRTSYVKVHIPFSSPYLVNVIGMSALFVKASKEPEKVLLDTDDVNILFKPINFYGTSGEDWWIAIHNPVPVNTDVLKCDNTFTLAVNPMPPTWGWVLLGLAAFICCCVCPCVVIGLVIFACYQCCKPKEKKTIQPLRQPLMGAGNGNFVQPNAGGYPMSNVASYGPPNPANVAVGTGIVQHSAMMINNPIPTQQLLQQQGATPDVASNNTDSQDKGKSPEK